MAASDRARWNSRYASADVQGPPTPFLDEVGEMLPIRGAALDVAAGGGRHATWLALRGMAVTACDVSDVGLQLARVSALAKGAVIETVQADLEAEPLPAGPWAVIVCVDYLQRSLYPQFAAALEPGGALVVVHPTRRNLERNPRPSARFLLEDAELPSLLSGLEVRRYEEGWFGHRHVARALAIKRR